MRTTTCLTLSLAVILEYIEFSSQTSNTGPAVHRSGTRCSPARNPTAADSSRSSPPDEPPIRCRSRSPLTSRSWSYFLGYTLEELKFIRFIPVTNPSRRFEIRRYAFPRDGRIRLRGDHQVLLPIPTEEQTVLSTSDGDVFAMIEDKRRLRGMFIVETRYQKRVKVNMHNSTFEEMTTEEIREAPLTGSSPILKHFGIFHIETELSSQTSNPGPAVARSETHYHSDRHHAPESSSTSPTLSEPRFRARSRSPPPRPAPSYILGYTPEVVRFIRLIPITNPSRQFKVQRYTFPCDTPIQIRGEHQALFPTPTEEQTVLSTDNGDVFAIVHDDRRLRGLYAKGTGLRKRVKVNMYSGVVGEMTTEEIGETPLGSRSPISKSFRFVRMDDSPPRLIRFLILNRFERGFSR